MDVLLRFRILQPTDPRFGAVTQFSTGASSHYNGLQLTAMKRLSHGLQGQINYTFSRCMDEVSNGGFLQFSAGASACRLCRESSREIMARAITTSATISPRNMFMNCRSKCATARLGYALNGWQISGTAFWHSGIPFSVLSTPYSANGNGIVQGGGPQFASVVPGVPALRTQSDSRRHAARHDSVAQSQCVRLRRGSQHRRVQWRRQRANLPVRKSRPQLLARSSICLERLLPHEMVSADRTRKASLRSPILQFIQPSEFRTAQHGA